MTIKTVTQAIERSISHTEIVTLAWTPALELELLEESEDSTETDGRLEIWGMDEDGAEWRVHLDTTGRAAYVTRVMSEIARQDQANESGDRYEITGSARTVVREWRSAAGQAGDLDLVQLIDAVGERECAAAYEAVRA